MKNENGIKEEEKKKRKKPTFLMLASEVETVTIRYRYGIQPAADPQIGARSHQEFEYQFRYVLIG